MLGSKWLLNNLNRLAFSVGVDEVTRFKHLVIDNEKVSDIISTYIPGSFTQWSADNVAHNVKTMDGKGTLHGLGIICSTTNKNSSLSLTHLHPIKHQKLKKVCQLIKNKAIPIKPYMVYQDCQRHIFQAQCFFLFST